jgi:hypothetical protein
MQLKTKLCGGVHTILIIGASYPMSTGGNAVGAWIYGGWNLKPAQQLRVSKFCESEMATKDTHLVLWSTRATPGISASSK